MSKKDIRCLNREESADWSLWSNVFTGFITGKPQRMPAMCSIHSKNVGSFIPFKNTSETDNTLDISLMVWNNSAPSFFFSQWPSPWPKNTALNPHLLLLLRKHWSVLSNLECISPWALALSTAKDCNLTECTETVEKYRIMDLKAKAGERMWEMVWLRGKKKKQHHELKAGVESKRAQKTKEQLCSTEHMANKVKQMLSTAVTPITGTKNVIMHVSSTFVD